MKRILNAQTRLDVALLSIRTMVGWVFVFHGAQKLFGWFGGHGIAGFSGYLASLGIPLPELNAYAAAGVEFFGGLALITGFGARSFAGPLVMTMLVASFTAHAGKFAASQGGMEYSLTLAVVTFALLLTGHGSLTLSRFVRRETAAQSIGGKEADARLAA